MQNIELKIKNNSAWPWLFLSAFIIFLDQLTKYLVQQHFELGEMMPIFSWLNLTMNFNPGAAFSFLGDAGLWRIVVLAGLSFSVSVALIIWLVRLARTEILLCFSLSLIIGGAIGNLIDRVRFNYVVDFVDFHVGAWHFATFNVADSAISVGAFFMVVKLVFGEKI
jgi:signal peptidase II